jgi:FkbM family methyltransferase
MKEALPKTTQKIAPDQQFLHFPLHGMQMNLSNLATRPLLSQSRRMVRAALNRLNPVDPELLRWRKDACGKSLREEYDLNEQSVVLDVGGYEGQWASDIFARYLCTIHVFEPIPKYADRIRARFARNNRVIVHQVGLFSETKELAVSARGDATSVIGSNSDTGVCVQLVAASEYFAQMQLKEIDLMKLNIEGAEYALIDHLISSSWIPHIRNLQIQFHRTVPDANTKVVGLRQRLAQTHSPTYQYDFVWENWSLKATLRTTPPVP